MVRINYVKRTVSPSATKDKTITETVAVSTSADANTTTDIPIDKFATEEVSRIEIATITQSPEYQVRQKTDQPTVNRYAEAIKAGRVMPPVRLARVKVGVSAKPMLVLVDGFHRLAAHEKLGLVEIQATVEDMEPELARWKAAEANMDHGLPLSNKERREAFKRFINAKQNVLGKDRSGNTKFMSYREMQAKLGINYGTLRNWTRTDFPKLYAALGDKVEEKDWQAKAKVGAEASDGKDEANATADPVAMLEAALKAYQATTDAQVRGQAVHLAKQIAEQMEKAGGWVDMTPEF